MLLVVVESGLTLRLILSKVNDFTACEITFFILIKRHIFGVSKFLTLSKLANKKGRIKAEDNSGTQNVEVCETPSHYLLSKTARFLAC
jgi:hypothetical protein